MVSAKTAWEWVKVSLWPQTTNTKEKAINGYYLEMRIRADKQQHSVHIVNAAGLSLSGNRESSNTKLAPRQRNES